MVDSTGLDGTVLHYLAVWQAMVSVHRPENSRIPATQVYDFHGRRKSQDSPFPVFAQAVNYTTNMHAHINNQPFYLLSILCVTHVINYSRPFSTFWNEATFQ